MPRTFNSAPTAPARNAAPSHANAESNNPIWSGNYADGGNNYTFVTAYWTESCIAWGTNDAYSTWVGIGGIGNNNLVQTGVDGVNANAFSHYYEAWVQNTGTNYDVNVFGVNCGDQIRTEVGTGDCMYVADATTGSTSGWRCQAPNANSSTAECIIERLSLSGSGLSPLSNFGNQTFHGCDVEINAGSNLGIGTVAHDYFNLYNGGTPLAVTGQISGGDTYTMTWQHYQ